MQVGVNVWLKSLLAVIISLLNAGSARAAAEGINLEMWLRRPGSATSSTIKGNLLKLDIKGLHYEELESYDIQYERTIKVRGLHLRDLLAVFKPIPENVDVILLHTQKGMIVPIAIAKLRQDIQVFIALEIWQDGKWRTEFPASIHPEANVPREVPAVFQGNKIVVGKDWRATDTGFTPWRHIDSITGIEFVESTAYYEQFRNVKDPHSGLKGRLSFMVHCQFCHGIKGLGATRGPDLTNVVEGLGKHGWEKIYNQVRSPGAGGAYPHFMPDQKDFSKAEAKDLILWLDSIRSGALAPYAPTYEKTVIWR